MGIKSHPKMKNKYFLRPNCMGFGGNKRMLKYIEPTNPIMAKVKIFLVKIGKL